jgi:hypothetical protein
VFGWGSSVRDMLSCAVRFLGCAFDSAYWGVISVKNEGVVGRLMT